MKKFFACVFAVLLLSGCKRTEQLRDESPFETNMEIYESVISSLSSDYFYAFADMGNNNDMLLISDCTFDNGDGVTATTEADVYGLDKNGKGFKYGHVTSGGTSYPLAVKDGRLYYGGYNNVSSSYIDETSFKMITDNNASFDDYEKAVVVNFFPVAKEWDLFGKYSGDDDSFIEIGKITDDGYPVTLSINNGEIKYTGFVQKENENLHGTLKDSKISDDKGIVVTISRDDDSAIRLDFNNVNGSKVVAEGGSVKFHP